MKKTILALATIALLVFAGVLVFMRPGGPSAAAGLAPADSIVFINLPDLPRTGFRWHSTSLAKIAAEPEVADFLSLPLDNLRSADAPREAEDILVDLKPGNIFLCILEGGSPTEADVLVGFQFWGSKEDHDKAVARLREELMPGAPVVEGVHQGITTTMSEVESGQLWSAAAGRWGFLATSEQLLHEAIDRAAGRGGAPPLAASEDYIMVASRLLADPELEVFIRADKAGDLLLAADEAVDTFDLPEGMAGLGQTGVAGYSLKFDGTLQREALFLGGVDVDSPEAIDHTAMELTSGESIVFAEWLVDFANLREALDAFNGAGLAAGLGSTEPEATFGPSAALVAEWPQGAMFPSPVLALEIKDTEAAAGILDGLLPGAASSMDAGGIAVHTVPVPFTNINIAAGPKFLVAGLDAGRVAELAAGSNEPPRLRESPVFSTAVREFEASNGFFAFVDTATVFTRLHESLVPVLRFSAMMMPDINRQVDVEKIPAAATIAKHLPPVTLSQSVVDGGILVTSSGPLTMTQLLVIGSAAGAAAAAGAPGF
jgi:hypothetical protein